MRYCNPNRERVRIAVQKSGRLHDASMRYLESCGLSFVSNGKSLIRASENSNVDVLYLRDDDIPQYLKRGVVDFGIVGQNVLAEKGIRLPVSAKLDFGHCRLVIAVSQGSGIRRVRDLGGKRIATSYPKSLKDFLEKRGVEARIVSISGSAEIAVALDLADAICDIVQTGATLKAHNLVPLCTILESQAVLVRRVEESPRKGILVKGLRLTV